jgi:energy-coupling factor transporter ATP-binding protein EcfA2
MFCREARIDREIYWAGFEFQVWLQLLTHLISYDSATKLVVDEPEIYLHPDLQHHIFKLLKESGKQIVLATHSAEIVNEAEHDEVVLVSRGQRHGRRVEDIEGLQEALFSIGSGQNIHLARLSRGRRILFLEGQDYKLLKRFAAKCGFSSFADELNITVVPIGGFTQREKIAHAAWTFEKVLRADIEIAALLDRDYRCEEEIQELIAAIRDTIPYFYVLKSKEIENYLLVPSAMARAARERARGRGQTGPDEEDIRQILQRCTDEIKSQVSGQIIANRMNFFAGGAKDPATVASEASGFIDLHWGDLSRRLMIVPGKQVLSAFNAKLQARETISITPPQIIRHMRAEEVGEDLAKILRGLEIFASGSG